MYQNQIIINEHTGLVFFSNNRRGVCIKKHLMQIIYSQGMVHFGTLFLALTSVQEMWLGGSDAEHEGQWVWAEQEVILSTKNLK